MAKKDRGGDAENERLAAAREPQSPWRKWGPYLSERQWGTVREDYSGSGDAWNHFTHDQARSRAYRWGEDGLAGISDDQQLSLFRPGALERQGPDPQGAALRPDQQRGEPRRGRQGVLLLSGLDAHALVHEVPLQVPAGGLPLRRHRRRRTAQRGRHELEYELLDTGVFDDDRYFDVFVEYAKASPEDVLIQITVANRGPERGGAARAADDLVPQHVVVGRRPGAAVAAPCRDAGTIAASHPELGERLFAATASPNGSSPRTTPTSSAWGAARIPARTSRTASTITSCTVSATR